MTAERGSASARFVAAAACLVGGGALLAGCIDANFEESYRITVHRPLAIVADPPEAGPGDEVAIRAYVVDPDGHPIEDPASAGLDVRFTLCLLDESTGAFRGAQYDPSSESGCGEGSPFVVTLPNTGPFETRTTLPDLGALLPAGALDDPAVRDVIAQVFGDLPPERVLELLREIGLPLTVELAVRDATGALLFRAQKRVHVSERATKGTNPPPPRLLVGDRWARGAPPADGRAPRCVAEDGERLTLQRFQPLVLAPDPSDDGWRETYQVLDIQGRVTDNREGAYYSWFVPFGTLAEDETNAPIRENIVTVRNGPRVMPVLPLTVVVRDGRGGTSVCLLELDVVD